MLEKTKKKKSRLIPLSPSRQTKVWLPCRLILLCEVLSFVELLRLHYLFFFIPFACFSCTIAMIQIILQLNSLNQLLRTLFKDHLSMSLPVSFVLVSYFRIARVSVFGVVLIITQLLSTRVQPQACECFDNTSVIFC